MKIPPEVPRVAPEVKDDRLPFNVGRNPRRQWRAGEPVHILKPLRTATVARGHRK